jgi:DNA-binding CsgD family transcriptional regulator/PAS domain-containing protein
MPDALLTALHEGLFDQPLWGDFLARLRATTTAQLALLALRPAGQAETVTLSAGVGPADRLGPLLATAELREGRAYALEELTEQLDPASRAALLIMLKAARIVSLRLVRVSEPGGLTGWLVAAGGPGIGAATGATLLALAPHLRIALRTFATLEREQFRSGLGSEAIARLKLGWLTLDSECRIVEASPNIEQMFQWGTRLRRGRYDRLVPAAPAADRQLTGWLKQQATGAEQRPLALNLGRDPWLDLLIAPLPADSLAGRGAATAIVYVSGDRRSQADRCEQLVDLFGLLPSEARLAWLLAQATGIAEAGAALGLTTETARNYSKKIYAKTGARGQADLVRIVMTSVLALS